MSLPAEHRRSFFGPDDPWQAVSALPAGAWGVAVSGGADSTALLRLMVMRKDCRVSVIHIDHNARPTSAADAEWVIELARSLRLRWRVARLSRPPMATETQWRFDRLDIYRRAMDRHDLDGILIGHHLDDVAETVLLRLMRSRRASGTAGLRPLRPSVRVGGVHLRRPLLGVRRETLRVMMRAAGWDWREDETNARPVTPRNRLRAWLARHPRAAEDAVALAVEAAAAETQLAALVPRWTGPVAVEEARRLPEVLRRRAAAWWLASQGVPWHRLGPEVVTRASRMLVGEGPVRMDLPGIRIERHASMCRARRVSFPRLA